MSLRIRRGGTVAASPPPPSSVFGPVNGVQPVRDGARPRVVTSPGGGVSFNSASNIQSLIDANAANTVFIASATGAYSNFRSLNYGDKHPRFYFPGAASSYSITGTGSGTEIGLNGNLGLEVHGGRWTNYAGSTGASYSSPIVICGDSIIEDAIFTLNAQNGLNISDQVGSTYRITRCALTSNGVYGIQGTGGTGVPNITLEYCEIASNNTSNFDCGIGCVTKFASSTTGTYRFNWLHGNNSGNGGSLWWDGANYSVQINDNVFDQNDNIFYEISYGGTVMEHNFFSQVTPSTDQNYPFNRLGIAISCSPCDASLGGPNTASEIRYNDFDMAAGYNTPLVLYDHGGQPATAGCRNWNVHHNRMTMRASTGKSRVGLSDKNDGTNGPPTKAGQIGARSDLLFDYNEYHVADVAGAYWNHDTAPNSPGALTWTNWLARGHDAHGTVDANL